MAANAKPVFLYDNILEDGTLAADDTAAGYSVNDIKDRRVFKLWKGNTSAGKSVTLSGLSPAQSANTLFIINHNFGTIGADIVLQYWDGAAWQNVTPDVGGWPVSPSSDAMILLTFAAQSATQWRLNMSSMSAAPQIGVLLLGTRLTMEKYLDGFDPNNETAQNDATTSKSGHTLGVTRSVSPYTKDLTFQNCTDAWVRANWDPAWNVIKLGDMFVLAWDITNHPSDLYYVRVPDGHTRSSAYNPFRRTIQLSVEGISE